MQPWLAPAAAAPHACLARLMPCCSAHSTVCLLLSCSSLTKAIWLHHVSEPCCHICIEYKARAATSGHIACFLSIFTASQTPAVACLEDVATKGLWLAITLSLVVLQLHHIQHVGVTTTLRKATRQPVLPCKGQPVLTCKRDWLYLAGCAVTPCRSSSLTASVACLAF